VQRQPANTDTTSGAEDALRVARARRMAWALGLVVLACYIGFMVLTKLKGAP